MDWITTEGDFRFVAGIDFETTGLNANIDRIVRQVLRVSTARF